MHADSYFVIGHSHFRGGKPCQDYATAAALPGDAAYAIVADGCSSGGKTDVGSRALALTTSQAIKHQNTVGNVLEQAAPRQIDLEQQVSLAPVQRSLGCTTNDMLSTCLYACYSLGGGFIHVQGDGVVAWEENGRTVMGCFEWDDNMPFYPAYIADNYAGFIAFHGGDVNADKLTYTSWERTSDGSLNQLDSIRYTLGEGIQGITLPLPAGLEKVAVFTDGVIQIEGLEWQDAVSQLLAFKTTRGDFAKRRMIRVVKDAQGQGKGPIDDISYAVILSDNV